MKNIVSSFLLCAGASLAAFALPLRAQNQGVSVFNMPTSSQIPAIATRDAMSDTWVATDALGRKIARGGEPGVPALRRGKTVIMFYYIWQGFHSPIGPNDISRLLAANPKNPAWGPPGSFHWWGEPEAGYYRAEDPWVIRRNMSMLADAGVDAIFFDATNSYTYPDTVKAVCEVIRSMRAHGDAAPQIGFVTHADAALTQQKLYDEFYSKSLYADLWFQWQGKPLILGEVGAKFADRREQSPEVKDFFTWRYSWAWDPGENKWPWLDKSPQKPNFASATPNIIEEVPVSSAEHPTSNLGKSYHNDQQPPTDALGLTPVTGQGLYFAEQWKNALKIDPQVVFVTQWNEWVAQRFVVDGPSGPPFLGTPTKKGDTFFVDVYNAEFNRDLEPMRGGWNDNYYYQLVDNIRRYKGARPAPAASKPQSVKIDGKFAEWTRVSPQFRDTALDTTHRDFKSYAGDLTYKNTSGRNDFIVSKVARDARTLYFYAQTSAKISPSQGAQWMQLFIDADQNARTGWNGYDFALNLRVLNNQQTTVSRYTGKKWMPIGRASFRAVGRELEISVPRALIGQKHKARFDFHWTDNASPTNLASWFTNGDSAPNRRFNFRFNG
ncbi:hypothetical protein B1R32_10661 [Abditibacterium utsteinense]|uniref:Glycosyl hydrolase family 71 n=1 Tax=Abditibacterium utsteinense TaxID=1960156 RepID=A0A2S8STU3_9BACT|nr:hypothetical protein [Abditibacterium utsteinense]PQV64217.1 hypothetical protein B1R32_10661 [Abditibacterium utsteinense]